MASKESILTFKCVDRGESYEKKFQEDLTKGFEEIYKLCDWDINKFFLMLQTDVYPYDYIDCWERFKETSLSDKK